MSNPNNTPKAQIARQIDKNKDWQLELLMEKLRSKSSQLKSFVETSKAIRMTLLEKHYAPDSVEKLQHQKCLDTLQHCIKVTSLHSMVERLESLTRQLGLKFVQGTNGMELFISSDMFYLEIVLDQSGGVCDVKVHHEGKVEQQSCGELVNCLSSGDFADFTLQLEGFTSIYQLNADKKVKCRAFTALQCLEADLNTLAQLQTFIKEPFNILYKSPVGVLEKRRGGHAMKITYFISPYDLINKETGDLEKLNIERVISKKLGYSATVYIEGGAGHKLQTCTLITVNKNHNGKGTPSYAALTNQNSSLIPACFILKLNKSMPLCLELIRQIQLITEIELSDVSGSHPLLSLIATHASDGLLDSGNNRGLFVTLPDQSHCYFMTENKALQGAMVNSIPFSHPGHVAQVINILRQQALFNTIIASCIRPNSKQDLESMVMLEVSALSWTHISIALEHPIEECMATAEIDLSDVTNLTCRIHSPLTPLPVNAADIASELTTKVLNRSFSIPITMRAILLHWEQQMTLQRRNSSGIHPFGNSGLENFNLPLGAGDPGGRNNNSNNNGSNGGSGNIPLSDRDVKQEPSSGMVMSHHPQQGMFLSESLSDNFNAFQASTTISESSAILTNTELSNILSGNNDNKPRNRQQQRRKPSAEMAEMVWKLTRKKNSEEELFDASSCDSTSRSTPLSQQDNNEIQTPNSSSALGFHSDLELNELSAEKEADDFDAEDISDVEEMLSGKKKSPLLTGDYDANKLMSPSVSITPISQNQSSFAPIAQNQSFGGSNPNFDRRPGIEIIPISTTATLPSSITITAISALKNDKEKDRDRKYNKRPDDKNRFDKKRRRKRDGSPMGPPDKIPTKSDPLSKPVTVSIKPAESPPNSPNRKFSPTAQQSRSLSGKLSPNLTSKSSIKTLSSPKHSPAHNNSPKHVMPPGHSSPKSSPKHPASTASVSSSSGKPSMSTLKNAANSPSNKSDAKMNKKEASSSSLARIDKEKKAGSNYISNKVSKNLSSIKVKPDTMNSTTLDIANCLQESGITSPGAGIDLCKVNNSNMMARNRKTGCLSAIVDKLNSKAQSCDFPVVDIISRQIKDRSLTPVKGQDQMRTKLGSETKNSEYVLKHSSDCMKLTINKTRSRDSSTQQQQQQIKSVSKSLNASGTGFLKNHTGLKPGVNSGPASKKPQQITTNKLASLNPVNSYGAANLFSKTSSVNVKNHSAVASSANLAKKLSISPKSGINKSNKFNKSEKSIFSNREKGKASPTQESESPFGLNLQNALMMDSLIKKQFDKSFQIPKLSARNSLDAESKKHNKAVDTPTTTATINNSIGRDSKIYDMINSNPKDLSRFPLALTGGKLCESNLEAKMRNSTASNLNAIPSSLSITSNAKMDAMQTQQQQQQQEDAGIYKENFSSQVSLSKGFPSTLSSEPFSLSARSIDLTSKFIANTPAAANNKEVAEFSSSSSSSKKDRKDASSEATTMPDLSSKEKLNFPPSPSVSVHIVKSPASSPLVAVAIASPHAASPGITDDELVDVAHGK